MTIINYQFQHLKYHILFYRKFSSLHYIENFVFRWYIHLVGKTFTWWISRVFNVQSITTRILPKIMNFTFLKVVKVVFINLTSTPRTLSLFKRTMWKTIISEMSVNLTTLPNMFLFFDKSLGHILSSITQDSWSMYCN